MHKTTIECIDTTDLMAYVFALLRRNIVFKANYHALIIELYVDETVIGCDYTWEFLDVIEALEKREIGFTAYSGSLDIKIN